MIISKIIIVVSALVVCSAPAFSQAAASSILKSFDGKSLQLSCRDGTVARGSYRAGKLTGSYQGPNQQPRRGVAALRAEGSFLCVTSRRLNNGAERCFGVVQISEKVFGFTVGVGLINACEIAAS